jgi:histidinol-phosphatase (PHP family)
MDHDYHTHSNYSDGRFLSSMARAANEAGLSGIGFADHCNVSNSEHLREARRDLGYNLDLTYERRRKAIDALRERLDIAIYDAVEMDYEPRDEDGTATFLNEAEFDYSIGSVHTLEGVNIHVESYFAEKSDDKRHALVDRYFEKLVSLADSELFDIAAHPDLIERNSALRGIADEDHYRRATAAFARSQTVPEINAGRVLSDYGEFHPAPDFLDILAEADVPITVGTDSHFPDEIDDRTDQIDALLCERGISPVEIV